MIPEDRLRRVDLSAHLIWQERLSGLKLRTYLRATLCAPGKQSKQRHVTTDKRLFTARRRVRKSRDN